MSYIKPYELHVGDCVESLKKLPEQSIHTCVTSPPYYGLRDYGVDGQIGREKTPEEYIQKMVEVFREVRRVLRDDGTLWLNIGDSYASSGRKTRANDDKLQQRGVIVHPAAPEGAKQKDLLGIPWMLAFALRADGWYLRQDIIWHKPNAMPESVRDRCTKAHEYVFLLSKSPRYFYDSEAIKEPSADPDGTAARYKHSFSGNNTAIGRDQTGRPQGVKEFDGKRNRRSVWIVNTSPFKGAHFATFPPALIETCILAGCPAGGTVLDPFGGSGTTAGVALAFGRDAVLCELNPEYAELVPSRIESIASMYAKKAESR